MRITLDLPENLIDKAMQISSMKSKNEIVVLALEELIRQLTISNLKDYKGKADLDVDLDRTRNRFRN